MSLVGYQVVEKKDDYVRLRVSGELANRFWTEHLREALEEHYVDDGVKIIRLDVSHVPFIDNYGVATLVGLLKESQERGKRIVVEGARGQVSEKLGVTGILKLLQRGA